jgi:hypothetical protein
MIMCLIKHQAMKTYREVQWPDYVHAPAALSSGKQLPIAFG